MVDKRFRKGLAVCIILLFIGICIIPSNAKDTEKLLQTSRGNWFYVGGSGPGNYSKIQDASDILPFINEGASYMARLVVIGC